MVTLQKIIDAKHKNFAIMQTNGWKWSSVYCICVMWAHMILHRHEHYNSNNNNNHDNVYGAVIMT